MPWCDDTSSPKQRVLYDPTGVWKYLCVFFWHSDISMNISCLVTVFPWFFLLPTAAGVTPICTTRSAHWSWGNSRKSHHLKHFCDKHKFGVLFVLGQRTHRVFSSRLNFQWPNQADVLFLLFLHNQRPWKFKQAAFNFTRMGNHLTKSHRISREISTVGFCMLRAGWNSKAHMSIQPSCSA